MRKSKLLIFIILILLIANTVFSSVLWFSIHQHPKPLPPPSRGQNLLDELQPDSSQTKILHSLMADHFVKLDALKEKEHTAKSAFFSQLLSDTASIATILNYAEHSAVISFAIDTLVYNHFNKLRSLCNPEQKEKLDRIIQRILIKSEDLNNVDRKRENDHLPNQNKSEKNKVKQGDDLNDFNNEMPPPPPAYQRHHPMPPPPEGHHGRPNERHPDDFPDGPPDMPPPGRD